MEHDENNPGIWSIGLYRGQSLEALSPYSVPQPIVTCEHFKSFNATAVADPLAIRRNRRTRGRLRLNLPQFA